MMSSGTPPSCTYVSELYELWGLAQTASMSLTQADWTPASAQWSSIQGCSAAPLRTPTTEGSSWTGSRGEQRNEETPEIQNTYCNSTHTENINVLTIQHTHKTRVKYTNHFQWKILNTQTLIIWQKRTKTHLVMARRPQLVHVTLEHTFLHVFVSVQNSKI